MADKDLDEVGGPDVRRLASARLKRQEDAATDADLRRADKLDRESYRLHMQEDDLRRKKERLSNKKYDGVEGKTFAAGSRDEGFVHPVRGNVSDVVGRLNHEKAEPYGDGVDLRIMVKPATAAQRQKATEDVRQRVRGEAAQGDATEMTYAAHGKQSKRWLDDDEFDDDEKYTPKSGKTPAR